jgi:predicted GNAT family acetyltransferase
MSAENTVRDNTEKRRFELSLGEGKTAFIQYAEVGEGVLALTHTEVPQEFEGQGVGGRLVKGAFEIVREGGAKIEPMCPFISAYLRRHPEYQSLVA